MVEVAKEVEEEVEGERRLMPAAVYTSISPLFYPASGYLNFEVAIEKSDSGMTMIEHYFDEAQHHFSRLDRVSYSLLIF